MYKITTIAPTPFFADRGAHVRILEEVKALTALGNEISICTYHNGRNLPNLDIHRIPNIPWYNKLDAGPSYHMFYLDTLLLLKSLMLVHNTGPDIIHAHLHEGALIGKFCSKVENIPVVFDLQGSFSDEISAHGFIKREGIPYKITHRFEEFLCTLTDAIIVSSTKMVSVLKEEFNVDGGKIFVVGDGVDTDIFKPNIDVSNLRKSLNIPLDKKVVVFLGLLNEYQGVDYLLKSIPLVLEEIKDVHFLIMGYPNVDKYKEMAKKLGIYDFVTFTGKINYNRAHEYLALGHISVSPKISETESNGKLYLYMASGLPTVVFDNQVNKSILGDLGVYARSKDHVSFANGIIKLLEDEELTKRLSIKVREKAVEDYSWKHVGKKIVDVYNKILCG